MFSVAKYCTYHRRSLSAQRKGMLPKLLSFIPKKEYNGAHALWTYRLWLKDHKDARLQGKSVPRGLKVTMSLRYKAG